MNSGPLITLLLLGVVFYLFLIAPQRRRQRQMQQLTRTLEPGTEVMTTAGLFATVRAVTDDEVELEVAPGVVSRYSKGAIARVIPPETEPADADQPAMETGSDPADALGSDGTADGTAQAPDRAARRLRGVTSRSARFRVRPSDR